MNSRSVPLSSSPVMPVMNARLFMGPISPLMDRGSRKRPLIPLDDALPAGAFQIAAKLGGLIGRPDRPHHGGIIAALSPGVGPFHPRRARPQPAGILALQPPLWGLAAGFFLLRDTLHQVPAAAVAAI